MFQNSRTANECRQAIATLLAELIPADEHDRWMLAAHSALDGDWPALAMQKGNDTAVYQLLLRLKQGHSIPPRCQAFACHAPFLAIGAAVTSFVLSGIP
jgi:hypothetical protein